jgi:uncharacterized protein (TIGR04255 family)
MIAPRHLPNAPIKEALIDIKVALPEGVDITALDPIYDQISAEYPTKNEIRTGEFGVHFSEDGPVTTTVGHGVIGHKYTSIDGAQIVQFRTNGFTFSRLEPYQTWESMKDEAYRLWKVYSDVASPSVITRIATRYINVLNLPLGDELEKYLVAPPELPEELPQAIMSYLSRIVTSDPEIDAMGVITQSFEGAKENIAPVVLDIDTFINKQFDMDAEDYWQCLESLREYKNRIFFESITETAAELFV